MTIAIDGHANGTSAASTTASASLTTAGAGLVFAIVTGQGSSTNPPFLNFDGPKLSDAGGKVATWHLAYSVPVDYGGSIASVNPTWYQVWWGVSSGAMTGNSFTATFANSQTNAALIVFGVSGANTSAPLDTNSTIFPGSLSYLGGFGTNKTNNFSTSCTNAMVVVLEGTAARGGPNGSISAGYTQIEATANASGTCGLSCAQKVVAATQSNLALQMGNVGGGEHVVMGFAIAAAGETACSDKPQSPMIASVARGGASTSGTTTSATLSTQNAEGIVIAAVCRDSNQAVTMSGSNVGTWTQYTTQNKGTDDYLDIWWAPVTGAMSANTITATLASAATHRSIIVAQITNCDTANPFDTHAGLPTVNSAAAGGNSSASAMTTSNAGDLALFFMGLATHSSPTTGFTTLSGGPPSNTADNAVGIIAGGADSGGDVTMSATWKSTAFSAFAPTTGSTTSGDWLTIAMGVVLPSPPSCTIDQTLPGFTQEIDDAVTEPTHIDQTLFALTQSLVAGVGDFMFIDQTLLGITQEIDVMSNPGAVIAQTLPGFTQEIDDHVTAGFPVFVNKGAVASQSFGTTVTPALPASLVNGNFLLAFVGNGATTGKAFTFPAGWNVIDSTSGGNLGGMWAWRFVDGTETAPAITWTGSTSAQAQIWQFSGVATVGAFNKQLDVNGFTKNWSASALTTTAGNSMVFVIEYNNNADTLASTPASYTSASNDGPISTVYEDVTTLGNSSAAISETNTLTTSNARTLSAAIELCSALPPIFATMAATEAKDVWAGVGSLLGGSWHSTEAKDLFNATGWVPLFFAIALSETPDHADFEVFSPPRGTWGSTEAADVMDMDGQPTPVIGVDDHQIGGSGSTTSGGITTGTVSITSTFTHDVIVLVISTGGFWIQAPVATVSDTAGLTWKRRVQRQVITNHLNGTTDSYVEEWWAHKPTKGTTTITVTTSAPTGAICLDCTAVKGANYTTPFDTHTGSGWFIDSDGDIIDRDGTGHIGNPHWYVWSNSSKMLTLAWSASTDIFPDTSVPAGWTFIDRQTRVEHSGNTFYLASMGQKFFTQQFGTVDTWFGPDATHVDNRQLLVESIIAADQTAGTDDVIRWFFDGTGNRLIEQFGVGQTTVSFGSGGLVSRRANSMAVVAVMTLSGANARVLNVSDSSNHSGWTRRSIVTNGSGAVALEIWYVEMGSVPINGNLGDNITITMDSNIQSGDVVSATCFAINGTDLFQRGEIWDGNGTLPATNHGTTGHQTVGPFNTSNDNVLVLNFGANIDTTANSTELLGTQRPPYLFLPPPAELASDGPPSYHIGLEFTFSKDVVTGATAEFDVSPAAQSWLMIADALAVGPVSPPHGTWASQEVRDHTGHNGDFTAIGIASPGGWVGFPPNHAALDVTEAPDKTANSGAFTAIWAQSEGWIGYVPAFLDLSVTEQDDVMRYAAWLLGPRTIIGHMHAGEAPDRLGFSGAHTFYTTPYSTGNRTSLITVTTNASLSAGVIENLVNGARANGPTNAVTFGTTQAAPVFVTFDFGSPQLVTEAIQWQNGPFAQPGLWKWRGSNDNATWTDLSATFTFDGNNIGSHVLGDFSSNLTVYRYYQMIQTTNAGTSDIPQLWETEFKVAGISGSMAASESKDLHAGNMLAIPTATPIPARKRRMLIVT